MTDCSIRPAALVDPARRRVLAGLVGASAMGLLPARMSRAEGPAAQPLTINTLGGLYDPNVEHDDEQDPLSPRVLEDLRRSGLDATQITVGPVSGPDEPFEASVRDIARWDRWLRAHDDAVFKVLSADDLLSGRREGRCGVIYGFQNGLMLGSDATRVDLFADLGVRTFQLTYNPANPLGDGSMAAENRGLTDFGRAVVARCNARRVMVDLSHSGERTCLDAIAASTRPISINHTGCRALTDLPRNKTDAELRAVAERGGFVGIS